MTFINTATASFGPFTAIDVQDTQLVCDGIVYPLDVLGAYTLGDARTFTPPMTDKQKGALQESIVDAVTLRVNTFVTATAQDAQGRFHGDYENVDALAKYQNLTDAQIASAPEAEQATLTMFRTDCQYAAFVIARTWAVLWATLAQVQAGNWPTTGAGQMPTGYADIEPSLPALEWPA